MASSSEVNTRIAQAVTQWYEGHARRRTIRRGFGHRRYLGIATAVESFDTHAFAVGARVFLPNHAVTWMAVRDVPRGQTPLSHDANRRGAIYVHTAQARLRYGMPSINFAATARNVKDLKYPPAPSDRKGFARPDIFTLPEHLREFELALAVSESMTDRAVLGRIHTPPSQTGVIFPRPYLLSPCRSSGADPDYRNRNGILMHRGNLLIPTWMRVATGEHSDARLLLWDVTHLSRFLHCEFEAFVLPPVPVGRWYLPRLTLGAGVDVLLQLPPTHQNPSLCGHECGDSPGISPANTRAA